MEDQRHRRTNMLTEKYAPFQMKTMLYKVFQPLFQMYLLSSKYKWIAYIYNFILWIRLLGIDKFWNNAWFHNMISRFHNIIFERNPAKVIDEPGVAKSTTMSIIVFTWEFTTTYQSKLSAYISVCTLYVSRLHPSNKQNMATSGINMLNVVCEYRAWPFCGSVYLARK